MVESLFIALAISFKVSNAEIAPTPINCAIAELTEVVFASKFKSWVCKLEKLVEKEDKFSTLFEI